MKQISILTLSFLLSFPAWSYTNSRILIVLNQGYRPEEYFEPRKIFEQHGFEVKVASHYLEPVLPSHAHVSEVRPVAPNFTFETVDVKNFAAVVFVGGNGAWNDFLPNPHVHDLLLDSVKQGKVTGLICAAVGLLATAQNLDGRHPQFKGQHVTGYYEVEGLLRKVGQVDFEKGLDGKPFVVQDGNLITGRDPQSAALFADTIVKALKRH